MVETVASFSTACAMRWAQTCDIPLLCLEVYSRKYGSMFLTVARGQWHRGRYKTYTDLVFSAYGVQTHPYAPAYRLTRNSFHHATALHILQTNRTLPRDLLGIVARYLCPNDTDRD